MLMRRKGLQASSEFLLGQGRNTLFGSSWFFLLHPFSTLGIHLFPRSSATLSGDLHMIGHRTALSTIGTISRTFLVPSVTSPACQSCLYNIYSVLSEPTQSFPGSGFRRNIMSACSFLSGSELGGQLLSSSNRMSGQMLNSSMQGELCYSCKVIDYCSRTSGSLKIREAGGNNSIYRCFWSSAAGRNFSLSIETHTRGFRASCTAPISAGAVPDLSFDAAPQGEQLENPVAVPDQKSPGERTLRLLSGSCYLPHPDKEKTGGEDAHFMCADEQVIGVADGVGGWANHGVDAGLYSRELMANSVAVIQDELNRSISIDPAMVLEKAYYSTKAKGSSTACIIALTNQGVHAVNLGDSGFIVIREGSIIFRSPVQQHDFNFTYQLESGNSSDLPSSAQVFTFPVASGDVIIAGTDGLFDNLYPNEVSAVVVQAVRSGLGPQVAAQKIAALARQRAEDKNRQTPFSAAAQNAGYRYYGGKLDDITVVVSYISAVPSL